MAEYIEREAAIEALVGLTIYDNAPALNAAVEKEYHNGREWIGGVRDALVEIGDLPVADVVAVVRCCECVYHDDESQYHYCRKWRRNCPNDSDFFCKWGKRMDGGQCE